MTTDTVEAAELSPEEKKARRDVAVTLARAIWQVETAGTSKEESQAEWKASRQERVQKARKILNRLNKKGAELVIAAGAEEDEEA